MMRRYLVASASAALLLLAAGGLLATGGAGTDNPPVPPTPSVAVETAVMRQQTLTDFAAGLGTVTTSDDAMVDIAFQHAGQVSLLHVRPGEAVRAGQSLIELTADPSALLSFGRAQAALDFAKQDLVRTQDLMAQHLATNAQLAAARKAVDDATAALATERQLGNDRRVEVVKAPYDGYIASLAVAPGDRLQANTTVMKLARTDQGTRIMVGLEPEEANRVKPGMTVELSPVFAPDQHLQGSVAAVSGTLNAVSKRIDAWINGPAAADGLVPGTTVMARIAVAQHTGWVVPRQAVLHDDAGDYVFQVAAGKARRVSVRVGLQTDQQTEISGSLDPTFPVVTLGNYELQDGTVVRESVAAAASGAQP
jgi:membrane fusion protein (multidrug efflux system)